MAFYIHQKCINVIYCQIRYHCLKGVIDLLKKELNAQVLIDLLINFPVVAKAANKENFKDVISDFEAASNVVEEANFLYDLFNLSTEEIIEKWYDKEAIQNAIKL